MTMAATEHLSAVTVWLRRLRFLLATGVIWALLHFIGAGFILPPGLGRPLVLSAAPTLGPLGGLLVVVLIWIATALAALILWPGAGRSPLIALGVALALWDAEGGQLARTMDAWLKLQNEIPGPPTGAPYWRLLPDYLYLILAVGGAAVVAAYLRPAPQPNASLAARLRHEWAPAPKTDFARGLGATLVATLIAGVAILFLSDPAAEYTYRGQVYFSVGIGLLLGVYAARQMTQVDDPIWFAPVPLLLGVIGLVAAAVRPTLLLPQQYRDGNLIPAWGLSRPLPIEMIAVGLVATLLILRAPARPASAEKRPSPA